MAKWEYAYISYNLEYGVQTWLPTSSDGSKGRTQEIPRKGGDLDTIIRQQIARLCEEGWEIFQVSTTIEPGTTTSWANPNRPKNNVYHFRRSS
jgi:hypothetical protein